MTKGLEALNELRLFTSCQDGYGKEKLDIIEKELKALEIIKQKMVDIIWIYACNNQIEYNDKMVKKWECRPTAYFLTKDEFNFLKEVLFGEVHKFIC